MSRYYDKRVLRPLGGVRANSTPSQKSYGKQKVIESSVYVPIQGRQNIQFRVYVLTQQEAKDAPDVITCII